ncbi:MAG: gamma-glutamyl-gamma-aminobutyrate hydrolase family protein [Chloroflexi bacterium]|nr:gamma-glutamyl-gamma-aminobutyrate hydrolase family protein [Chloroflexota bacterium]
MFQPRPLIGISAGLQTTRDGRTYVHLPESYARAVGTAGGAPVLIPPLDEPDALERIVGRLDGLLFPGGKDVEPALYGEARHPKVNLVDGPLDALEMTLASLAVQMRLPTLGICRGQQALNVALGGTLFQDLPTEPSLGGVPHPQSAAGERADLAHAIRVASDSRLASILGATDLGVNSFHHQAVRRLGRGLKAVAWAADGVVEGLESEEHPWLFCVQFHPEDLIDDHPPSRRLFAAFVEACASGARDRTAAAR